MSRCDYLLSYNSYYWFFWLRDLTPRAVNLSGWAERFTQLSSDSGVFLSFGREISTILEIESKRLLGSLAGNSWALDLIYINQIPYSRAPVFSSAFADFAARNKKTGGKASSRPEHLDHTANQSTQIATHKNDRIKITSGAAITATDSDKATIFRRQALVGPPGPAGLIHNGKVSFFFAWQGLPAQEGMARSLGAFGELR